MRTRRIVAPVGCVLAVISVAAGLAGCGDDQPSDGFHSVASGDTYGEWELLAEYEDGEWTGCLRMDYDEDGPMCADPDRALVRFEDWTGAQYGAVAEGERLVFEDGGDVGLIDDRFFVVIEGARVGLASDDDA